MQLKFRNISGALATATCGLLGSQASAEEAQAEWLQGWDLKSALLYYSEGDRVTAIEGIVAGSKEFDTDEILSLKLTIDSLTGASANGAIVQRQAQTFTRPSGKESYQVAAGDTPLDHTFKDTRVQINVNWQQPLDSDWNYQTGFHFSKEYDYLSAGLSGGLSRYFDMKNTTVAVGLSYFDDSFNPEGGRPVPLATMVVDTGQFASEDDYWQAFNATRLANNGDKQTIDLLASVTQVISKTTLAQLSYSYSDVSGYLTDPFKVVSMLDTQGVAQQYRYESRPSSRRKHSIFSQIKHFTELAIYDVSYRYMRDDWQIESHTLETRIRFDTGGDSYLQPHLRFYRQQAAEFYRPYHFDNQPLPDYLSADYRIGDMDATTLGLKFGWKLASGKGMAVRLEYYQQQVSDHGFDNFGLNISPSVDAIILQLNYDL